MPNSESTAYADGVLNHDGTSRFQSLSRDQLRNMSKLLGKTEVMSTMRTNTQ
jgi:hypothetical protein